MAKDSACGMEVDAQEATRKGLVTTVRGEQHFFCCKECKEEFLDKPPAYPDHCATCMKKCDLKETIWKIKHENELYCFCSAGCKEGFVKKKFG